jgi:hypothetical protein
LEKTVGEAMFSELGGESKAWQYLISHAQGHDARLFFDILRYWTDRKYGKPFHRIEAEVDVSADDIVERIIEGRKRMNDARQAGLLPENSR